MSPAPRAARQALVLCTIALPLALGAAPSRANGDGVYAGVSTLGLGVGLTHSFSPALGLRVGYNGYNYNRNFTEDGTSYNGTLKLSSVELLADYRPFANGFTVSAGLLYNQNKITANASAGNGSVTINGTTYTGTSPSAQFESSHSPELSPYLGLGWNSNPANRAGAGLNVRLGVIHQNLKGNLTTSGISDPNGTLASDQASAEQTINNQAARGSWYPVVGVDLTYAF
jgi:hypothetical protein